MHGMEHGIGAWTIADEQDMELFKQVNAVMDSLRSRYSTVTPAHLINALAERGVTIVMQQDNRGCYIIQRRRQEQ